MHPLPLRRQVPNLGATLDHIFVSTDCAVTSAYYPLPFRATDTDQLHRLNLPNHEHPSDHLPIGAVIRLRHPGGGASVQGQPGEESAGQLGEENSGAS